MRSMTRLAVPLVAAGLVAGGLGAAAYAAQDDTCTGSFQRVLSKDGGAAFVVTRTTANGCETVRKQYPAGSPGAALVRGSRQAAGGIGAQAVESLPSCLTATPSKVVAGKSKTVRFDLRGTGESPECTVVAWAIYTSKAGGPDFGVWNADDNSGIPTWTFDGLRNADAGPTKVAVLWVSQKDVDDAVEAGADEPASHTALKPFGYERATGWTSFNATPEPVAANTALTLKAELIRVDWDKGKYVPYANRAAVLQFKPVGGSYADYKTVKTDRKGKVSATVSARRDGSWRIRYAGNAASGASVSKGDAVDVR